MLEHDMFFSDFRVSAGKQIVLRNFYVSEKDLDIEHLPLQSVAF